MGWGRPLGPLGAVVLLAVGCSSPEEEAGPSAPAPSADTASPAEPSPAGPSPQAGAGELLPDLSSLPAYDVHIEPSGDTRLLRFAAMLANTGPGPLRLVPEPGVRCPPRQRSVSQVVYADADGDNAFTPARDTGRVRRAAGCMVLHPAHNHWHFDASAQYTLTAAGSSSPVARSDKVSFCLRDSHPLGNGAVPQTYGDCDRDSVQGISPGWGDEYSSDLDGQALRLPADLPDGQYCLSLTADPYNLLRETDDSNNVSTVGVRITGFRATAAEPSGCAEPAT